MTERDLNADMTPVAGDGMCCAWEPGYRPSAGYLAWERILDLAISDALEDAGFAATVTVQQEGEVRHLLLLGPDSPGEYILTFHPVRRDAEGEAVEAMRQAMIRMERWIRERGTEYRAAQLVESAQIRN